MSIEKYYGVSFYVQQITKDENNPYPFPLWNNRVVLSGFIKTDTIDSIETITQFSRYGEFGDNSNNNLFTNYLSTSDTAFSQNNQITTGTETNTFAIFGSTNIRIPPFSLGNVIKNRIKQYYPTYVNVSNMNLRLNITTTNPQDPQDNKNIKFLIYDSNNNNYPFQFNNLVIFKCNITLISQPSLPTERWCSVSYKVLKAPAPNPFNVKIGDIIFNGFFLAEFDQLTDVIIEGTIKEFYDLTNFDSSDYINILSPYSKVDNDDNYKFSNAVSNLFYSNSGQSDSVVDYKILYNSVNYSLKYLINYDYGILIDINDNLLGVNYKTTHPDISLNLYILLRKSWINSDNPNPDPSGSISIFPLNRYDTLDYSQIYYGYYFNENSFTFTTGYNDGIPPLEVEEIITPLAGPLSRSTINIEWYSINIHVSSIDSSTSPINPLTLNTGYNVFKGYIKAEVQTDLTGKLVEFYDLTQIGKNGKYINLLQYSNLNDGNNLIYFDDEEILQITNDGIICNIDNNITFKRKYLKYINTNYPTSGANLYLKFFPSITNENNLIFKLYDDTNFNFTCNADKIEYTKTVTKLSSVPDLTALTTEIWYEFSMSVNNIGISVENPLGLRVGQTAISGYMKVSVRTDYTGTFGVIRELYDKLYINANTGVYQNVLKDANIGEINLIYFNDFVNDKTNFNLTNDGINISITNNNLLKNFLNRINNQLPTTDINNLCLNMHASVNGIAFTVYDSADPSKKFEDSVYYSKTINKINELPPPPPLQTLWYEVSFTVKELSESNNPLSLKIDDIVLKGYIEIEVKFINTLTTGIIKSFYDFTQINVNGTYINILDEDNSNLFVNINNNVITFSQNGIYVDISNNINLKYRYLNYIIPGSSYNNLFFNIRSEDVYTTTTKLYTNPSVLFSQIVRDSNAETNYEANVVLKQTQPSLNAPSGYPPGYTKWYSIYVSNPQYLTVLYGFFKVENIRTDYTGEYGTITNFYVEDQILNGQYKDILQHNITSYFNTTNLKFIGIYISVQNWLSNTNYDETYPEMDLSLRITYYPNEEKIKLFYYNASTYEAYLNDNTKYPITINEISGLPPITIIPTKWYSISFELDTIDQYAENPLNLQIGDKVLSGFFKVENIKTGDIKTGNKQLSLVYYDTVQSDGNNIFNVNFGTYGTITEFYDLAQVSNGKYINILRNINFDDGNNYNIIYFVDGQPYFTLYGAHININNNSVLYANCLNFIKERNIDYYNNYPNMQLDLGIGQLSTFKVVSPTTYTMDSYHIEIYEIFNTLDSNIKLGINPYKFLRLKINTVEISGPLSPSIIQPSLYLKKNKYGNHSASSRLLKLKNKNINNVKNSYENGYYVKNTTEQNSVNSALSRTRASGYIVPPKITKKKDFF
jgi:hypothetical protein